MTAGAGVAAARREVTNRGYPPWESQGLAGSAGSAFNTAAKAGLKAYSSPLYFSGQPGRGFGWGVCNRHLLAELSKLALVRPLERRDPLFHSPALPGDHFTPLQGHDFHPFSPARGRKNLGYAFFENELVPAAVENARRFDVVFAGSRWCEQRLQEQGITHTVRLIQGVDTAMF